MTLCTSLSPRPDRFTSDDRSRLQRRNELHRVGNRMRRLERRQDAFESCERLEAVERLGIRDVRVFGATELAQPRVLRSDRGVIKAGRDRMRQLDIARVVLQDERARPLQHAGAAAGEAGGVAARRDRLAAGFDANQPHARVVEESVEDPDGVAAAADAGDDDVGQPSRLVENLRARLASDHRLELAHHQRVRMRAERRAKQVVRVRDVGDPVAHRLVDRVLERAAAGVDAVHRRAEQLHPNDVERLAPHVLGAHVDAALEAEQRTRGRRGDAVLAGAGFGDDAALAHAPGEQRLAEGVVDLVSAGVRQVLALEKDAHVCRVRRTRPTLPAARLRAS